jgi:holo-[acyl-carrier protein] synthase
VIIGIGVDVVDIKRMHESLARTPNLAERLFHERERGLKSASLAARFGAKEALAKALGDPSALSWVEILVPESDAAVNSGKPEFEFFGATADYLSARGVKKAHLSLSHDGGVACAMVVLEG